MNDINLTLPQILSLVGLLQCTYLLGYIALRTRLMPRAGLPLLYFGVLALAFLSDLAAPYVSWPGNRYFYLQWALWFMGPPLSVLMVIQLADMTRRPPLSDAWVFLLLPLSFMLSHLAATTTAFCQPELPCEPLQDMMNVTGLMAGTISLLLIFSKKDLLQAIPRQKQGRARYWLVLSLILLNVFFLSAMLLHLMGYVGDAQIMPVRDLLGLGFVYLAGTSLLRLYPDAPRAGTAAQPAAQLSEPERILAEKIEKLMDVDKVYQEPTYSRADLARECAAPESLVSRVINAHFGKSFPQLVNERRIEDAKRLLKQTEAPVAQIASEVGFNSLPSFNRVFKDLTGESPSGFRKAG